MKFVYWHISGNPTQYKKALPFDLEAIQPKKLLWGASKLTIQ